jgi:hypothetical protein
MIGNYRRPISCLRHGEYDRLTFDKGQVLNVKIYNDF